MYTENAPVAEHRSFLGGYRLLVLDSPRIAPAVRPGQFVHLRVPHLDQCLLRRPFSVFRTDRTLVSLLYKDVGRGTHALARAAVGDRIDLLGPLGRGYPPPQADRFPVLVAGGYGMAALFLVARESERRGAAFFGGAGTGDILCRDEFQALGWEVHVATEDGTLGTEGLVTRALDVWLEEKSRDLEPEFFACGPNAMLRAVADRAVAGGWPAWVSMDRNMGCGVGACLTCVQRVRAADGEGWHWARVCREGPVFECREVIWDDA